MTRSSKKISRTIKLAKHTIRIKRADGGETDPMLDSDVRPQMPDRDWGPAITPEQAFSAPKEETKPSLVDRAFSTVTGGRNLENDVRNLRERLPDTQEYGTAVQHAVNEARQMQNLGVENMKSGEVGRSVLGAAQVPLGYFNQAIAPVTGGFELASQAAGRFDPRLKAEADVIGLLGTEGSSAFAKAANTAKDVGSYVPAATLATAAIPAKAGEAERAVQAAKEVTPRSLSDLGFYSHGAETAANLPQAKGSADQLISMLRNQGVRPAELEHAGLIDATGAVHPEWAGRNVTREELSQHLAGAMPQIEETILRNGLSPHQRSRFIDLNEAEELGHLTLAEERELAKLRNLDEADIYDSPKFQDYALPGGENYRELLLKLPSEKPIVEPEFVVTGGFPDTFKTRAEAEAYIANLDKLRELAPGLAQTLDRYPIRIVEQNRQLSVPEGVFKSDHWPDQNVLAHVRMSDRTGPNGEKLLHVEELQSDWGQEGRKSGFHNPKKPYEAFDPKTGTPLANFETIEEAEKFVMNHPNGRFLDWGKAQGPAKGPYVTNTQGWTDLALKRVMKEAAEGGYDGVVFTPGAEQAKRYPGTSEEGMQGYYDKIIPTQLSKLAKQYDKETKLGKIDIPGASKNDATFENLMNWFPETQNLDFVQRENYWDSLSLNDRIKLYEKFAEESVPREISGIHLPITDKMRESILGGQRAFTDGGRVGFAAGGAPWNTDLSTNPFEYKPSQGSNVPLANMNLYKGAALNTVPEVPAEKEAEETGAEAEKEEVYRPEGSGGSGESWINPALAPSVAPNLAQPPAVSPTVAPATTTGFGDFISNKVQSAVNNPLSTAVNIGVGFVPGFGMVNTLSGFLGGPTVGGLISPDKSAPAAPEKTTPSKMSMTQADDTTMASAPAPGTLGGSLNTSISDPTGLTPGTTGPETNAPGSTAPGPGPGGTAPSGPEGPASPGSPDGAPGGGDRGGGDNSGGGSGSGSAGSGGSGAGGGTGGGSSEGSSAGEGSSGGAADGSGEGSGSGGGGTGGGSSEGNSAGEGSSGGAADGTGEGSGSGGGPGSSGEAGVKRGGAITLHRHRAANGPIDLTGRNDRATKRVATKKSMPPNALINKALGVVSKKT